MAHSLWWIALLMFFVFGFVLGFHAQADEQWTILKPHGKRIGEITTTIDGRKRIEIYPSGNRARDERQPNKKSFTIKKVTPSHWVIEED